MSVRRSSRRSPRGRLGPRVWVTLGAVALILLGGAVALTMGARHHLRSDAFRRQLSAQVSGFLGVEGAFSPLRWEGSTVYAERFESQSGGPASGAKSLLALGVRATIDFGSWRRDKWHVNRVDIDRLSLVIRDLSVEIGSRKAASPAEEGAPRGGGMFRSWMPHGVDVDEVNLREVEVRGEGVGGSEEWVVSGIRASLTAYGGDAGWAVTAEGGGGRWPGGYQANLRSLQARFAGGDWFLTRAEFEVWDHATLEVAGEFSKGPRVLLFSETRGVDLSRVLSPDWRARLVGTLSGEVRSERTGGSSWRHEGKVAVRGGILRGLPLLDSLAEHTRKDGFRNLVLSRAEAPFLYDVGEAPGTGRLSADVDLRADGLFRLTGKVEIENPFEGATGERRLRGILEVGVPREVLRWLPGAENRVFTEERGGYLHTTMRLGGTLEEPEEDLSPRLRQAAMATTVEAVPGTVIGIGRGVLDSASGALGPGAGGLLRGLGGQVLDETDRAIQESLKMVPLLGGPSR